ncbi:MAG: hypothetical protein KDA76_17550 [Planctomycetaceae bacterium]|nr:hypothetical protein [Planctomycetaceae bacterium]
MTPRKTDHERLKELLIELVDGQPSEEQLDELQQVAKLVPDGIERMVDHLLLDSLLGDDLGREPLTALVDLVAEPVDSDLTGDSASAQLYIVSAAESPVSSRRSPGLLRTASWLALAASVALVVFLLTGHGDSPVYASASQIVEAAIHTHAEPIERVYVVEVERNPSADNGLNLPRDVKVSTQGDRFWVEMNGYRRWAWGRDADGAIWMTLGPRRAVVVGADEMGVPLKYIGDLYTLHLETLLQNFLKNCQLERAEGPAGTDIITAVPRRRWSERPLKRATIEVDRETKAIRRLVVEREFPDQSSTVVTFTLVDSRLADEEMYRPEGHLTEPRRLFARETDATKRRELMVNWFGPHAERWIQIPETTSNDQ